MLKATTSTRDIVAPSATFGDLAAIMADLSRAHPEAGHRVQHGAFLALMGHAERSTPRSWWVTSERDPQAQYLVLEDHGTCTCQDYARHGALSPCKHLLCVAIIERLERLEVDREQLAAEPIAWELTPAAYAALDALGEPVDLPLQCPRCHAEPAILSHIDHLGPRCLADEMFGTDPAA